MPFSITPDPGYLYLSEYHREALAHLVYGIGENGGFVQLTGEVGTGKTTLIRALLAQNMPDVEIAVCLNPRLSVLEFVALILDELGVDYPPGCQSLKHLIDLLNEHLLAVHARGGRTVVIVDEAQNLCRDVLEQVRLLTNLETSQHKLLRIILVGQPELREMLARRDLRQLAQRITARYHLLALDRQETTAYIKHRLHIAGAKHDLFSKTALGVVYRNAQGIPRLINIVCDRALLGAYANNKTQVTKKIAKTAAAEILSAEAFHADKRTKTGTGSIYRPQRPVAVAWAGLLLAGVVIFFPQPLSRDTGTDSVSQVEDASDAIASVDSIDPVEIIELENSDDSALAPGDDLSDLDRFLALAKTGSSEVSQLLALWQLKLDEAAIGDGDVCAQLEDRKFRCLSDSGDWATLKRYNRPAIIALVDSDGFRREVLLESLSETVAVLINEQDRIAVNLGELNPLWNGEFFLIWQTPPYAELIGPGSSGEKVIWLRRRLAQIEQRQLEEPLSAEFDNNLLAQVKRFQSEHKLEVDGLVGTQTLQLLHNLAPAPSTPLLVRTGDEAKDSG